MSNCISFPFEGNLEQVLNIVGCLKQHNKIRFVFDYSYPKVREKNSSNTIGLTSIGIPRRIFPPTFLKPGDTMWLSHVLWTKTTLVTKRIVKTKWVSQYSSIDLRYFGTVSDSVPVWLKGQTWYFDINSWFGPWFQSALLKSWEFFGWVMSYCILHTQYRPGVLYILFPPYRLLANFSQRYVPLQ